MGVLNVDMLSSSTSSQRKADLSHQNIRPLFDTANGKTFSERNVTSKSDRIYPQTTIPRNGLESFDHTFLILTNRANYAVCETFQTWDIDICYSRNVLGRVLFTTIRRYLHVLARRSLTQKHLSHTAQLYSSRCSEVLYVIHQLTVDERSKREAWQILPDTYDL